MAHRPIVDLMDLTCDDGKVCTLSYEFLSTCVIHIKDDQHPSCQVPCHMEHCREETHFYINCPVYFCSWGPTPGPTPPPAPGPSPGPSPGPTPPPSGPSHAGYASSVTFNVICVAVFAILIGRRYARKRNQQREGPIIRQSQGLVNPLYDDERTPLLARINFRRHQRPSRTNDIGLTGFDAAEARFLDAAEAAPRPEPETLSDFAELDLEAGSRAPPFPSRSFGQKLRDAFRKVDTAETRF